MTDRAAEILSRPGWSLHDAAWLWGDRLPGGLSSEDRTRLREVMDIIRHTHAVLLHEARTGRLNVLGQTSEPGPAPDRFNFIDAAHYELARQIWLNKQSAAAMGCDGYQPNGTGIWLRQAYVDFAQRCGERPNFLFHPEHFLAPLQDESWQT